MKSWLDRVTNNGSHVSEEVAKKQRENRKKTSTPDAVKLFSKAMCMNKSIEAFEVLGDMMKNESLYRSTGLMNYLSVAEAQMDRLDKIIDLLTALTDYQMDSDSTKEINKAYSDFKDETKKAWSEKTENGKGTQAQTTDFYDRKSTVALRQVLANLITTSHLDNNSVRAFITDTGSTESSDPGKSDTKK
jgi:hypothetical protein